MSRDAPAPPVGNGAILMVAQILKHVMSSAAEAELSAIYINAHKDVYIRQILTELGNLQHWTPMKTEKSTAVGIINNKILPKVTKAMDMCFHWLCFCVAQEQFSFSDNWDPLMRGTNLASTIWAPITKKYAPPS